MYESAREGEGTPSSGNIKIHAYSTSLIRTGHSHPWKLETPPKGTTLKTRLTLTSRNIPAQHTGSGAVLIMR